MTAYVSRGDRVIVYAGNLNIGQLEAFVETLRGEGVEVLASLTGAATPTGRPEILAVIEKDECENCGYSQARERIGGLTVDSVIVDEAVAWTPEPGKTYTPVGGSHDCIAAHPHPAHVWAPGGPDTLPNFYCKGVPA